MNTYPKITRSIILCAMTLLFWVEPNARSEYDLVWHTIDGGGGTSSGGQYVLRACEKIPVCLRFRAGGAGHIAGWWYKRGHEHGRHNSAIVKEWE